MKGTYNYRKSWEKQSVYSLDNGWIATVEWSHYGEMVSRLDSPKGEVVSFKNCPEGKPYWHCSDGLDDLPEFARPWLETVVQSAGTQLVRPRFEKVFLHAGGSCK
jgi:hypothetical protein